MPRRDIQPVSRISLKCRLSSVPARSILHCIWRHICGSVPGLSGRFVLILRRCNVLRPLLSWNLQRHDRGQVLFELPVVPTWVIL